MLADGNEHAQALHVDVAHGLGRLNSGKTGTRVEVPIMADLRVFGSESLPFRNTSGTFIGKV
jgi:hypothetical protein